MACLLFIFRPIIEGAQTSIDIKNPFSWYLSSVPTSGFLGAEAKKNEIFYGRDLIEP